MADRGTYRSIKTVLLDGPDFQQLSPEARWAFVALKLSMGPSGIEVHYREAILHEIAEKTGHMDAQGGPSEGLRRAFLELETEGWVRWERNVLWIVGQLKHDPSLNNRDKKHRMSIQRHVSGLPRLAIIRRFINEHRDFFPEEDGNHTDGLPPLKQGPTEGHGRAMEGPSESLRSTEDRIPKTEEGIPKTEVEASARPRETPTDPGPHGPEPPPQTPTEAMEAVLAEYLSTVPDGLARRKLEAQARLVLQGEDPKAWEVSQTGDKVPEDERPELFRMALGYHRDGTQSAFRSSVRYVVKLYQEDEGGPRPNVKGRTPNADARLARIYEQLKNTDLEVSFQ